MRAIDRISRRAAAAAASAQPRGVLRRNDAGELVPLAGTASSGTDVGTDTATATGTAREIDGQGWAR